MSFTYTIEPTFLTKEECNMILDFSLKELELEPSQIFSAYTDGGNVNTNIRESNQVFYPYYEKFPFLLEKMSKLLNQYIFVKGFDLDFKKSQFQFTQYYPGGHFDWHKDTGKKVTDYDRYCSLVIQLNDEYDEGNLQIKDNQNETLTIEKGTGNLILFLSNIEHRVVPVKSGIRYTLVNWVKLKQKKDYKKTLL
jgi:predicted 2-oxoglutarate/Fe(II)-dependent dioxygenase YbiX